MGVGIGKSIYRRTGSDVRHDWRCAFVRINRGASPRVLQTMQRGQSMRK